MTTRPGEEGASDLPAAWRERSHAEWCEILNVPRLELHAALPSTNARLLKWAEFGVAPFTTVIAGMQTEGRGRVGRRWHSPEGAGLWMSVLLPPGTEGEIGVLPLAVGAAAANAIEGFADESVGLKWPNDLLLGDRKVAGILCEVVSEPAMGVVVGIGVNVRRPAGGYPTELDRGIAALEEARGGPVAEPELAGALIRALRKWACPPPARLSGRLREEWDRRDRLLGRTVLVDTGVSGKVLGVSVDGSLELLRPDGRTVTVRAGTVRVEGGGESPALHRVEGEDPGQAARFEAGTRGGNAEET